MEVQAQPVFMTWDFNTAGLEGDAPPVWGGIRFSHGMRQGSELPVKAWSPEPPRRQKAPV